MGTFCDIPIDRVMANLLKDKTKNLYAGMFALNLNQIVTTSCEKKTFSFILTKPVRFQEYMKEHSACRQAQILIFQNGSVTTYFVLFHKNCLHYIKIHSAF